MTEEKMQKMAEGFCAMELPRDFAPDGGIHFTPPSHPNHEWPTGTNLFTVDQAVEIVRHMISEIDGVSDSSQGTGSAPQFRSATKAEESCRACKHYDIPQLCLLTKPFRHTPTASETICDGFKPSGYGWL